MCKPGNDNTESQSSANEFKFRNPNKNFIWSLQGVVQEMWVQIPLPLFKLDHGKGEPASAQKLLTHYKVIKTV